MSPVSLRDALVDAVDAGDDARVRKLAAKQADAIREHFPAWRQVPEAIRANAPETKRYLEGLIAVAQHFRSTLHDPSLMEQLAGPPAANPLVAWQEDLRRAQEAIAAGRYPEAEAALAKRVGAARTLSGTGVDRYLPMTLGLIAQCRFHRAKVAEALPLYWEALELCDRAGDLEGQIAYLSSLHEAQRWLGEPVEAAALADRLADRCERAGNHERTEWARRRAQRVRDGEPLNRVVLEAAGKQLELDELATPLPDGPIRFLFERNRLALGAVTALVEQGGRLGSQGDDAGALGAFRTAAALDPSDPRPHYFAGLAQMGLRRYPDAVASYEQTERLAPGWYHCRADRAIALDLAAQRIRHTTFEAVRAIEDGGKPATEKVALVDLALAAAPDLPILYLLKASALIEMKTAAAAAEAARAGLARDPDLDVRTRLLVALARVTRPAEGRPLLDEAITLDGNRIAAAMARVMLLSAQSN